MDLLDNATIVCTKCYLPHQVSFVHLVDGRVVCSKCKRKLEQEARLTPKDHSLSNRLRRKRRQLSKATPGPNRAERRARKAETKKAESKRRQRWNQGLWPGQEPDPDKIKEAADKQIAAKEFRRYQTKAKRRGDI